MFKSEDGFLTEEQIVGKINVQSYEPKTDYTLYIYAVNGQSLPEANAIQTYLNNIYGQALINWTVKIKKDLKYSGWDTETADTKIQVSGSDELKAYTEEQKNIIKYFRDQHDKPKGNEFVLFWSPEASESGAKGFMPLSKRYGFIFSPKNNDATYRTVAHELGHGAFALRHTWKVFDNITKGDSKNLMDYDGGLEIWKWQWDLIQNPAPMVGFENEDQDGQIVTEGVNTILARFIKEVGCAKSNNLQSFDFYYAKSSADQVSVNGWGLGSESFTKALGVTSTDIGWSNTKNLFLKIPDSKFSKQKADLFHYAKFPIDVSTVIIHSQRSVKNGIIPFVEIGSGSDKVFINLSIQIEEEEYNELYSIVNKIINNYQVTSLTDISVESIATFSQCDFENLSVDNRKKLLADLVDQVGGSTASPTDDDTKQLFVVRILESITTNSDRLAIYDYFDSNQKDLVAFYESMDDETKDWFIIQLTAFWHLNNKSISLSSFDEGVTSFLLSSNFWGNAEQKLKLDVSTHKLQEPYIYYERDGAYPNGQPKNLRKVGYKNLGSLFTPFKIVEADDIANVDHHDVVPGIFLLHLLDKENLETARKYRSLALDVALTLVGVGEITMAVRAYKTLQLSTIIYKASLGVADVGITALDQMAEMEEFKDSEFIIQWKGTVGTVTKVAFLAVSIKDIQKSFDEVSPELNRLQVKNSEGELLSDVIESRIGLSAASISIGSSVDISKAINYLNKSQTDDVLNVLIHSDGNTLKVFHNDQWHSFSVTSFKVWLSKQDDFKNATKIKLLSCEVAGVGTSGANDLAKQISQKINTKTILASEKPVWVHKNGAVTSGVAPNVAGEFLHYKAGNKLDEVTATEKVTDTSSDAIRMGSKNNVTGLSKYINDQGQYAVLYNKYGDKLDGYLVKLSNYVKAAEGKAGALALMSGLNDVNQLEKILTKLTAFNDKDKIADFLRICQTENKVINVSHNISKHLSKLTEDHIQVWGFLYDKNKNNRKCDFVWIDTRVQSNMLSQAQIDTELLKTANRTKYADGEPIELISKIIRESVNSYRSNLINSYFKIANESNGVDKLVNIYKNDTHLYNGLLALKEKSVIMKTDITEVFKGYHAHHIISANNLWDKEGKFYELLIKADKQMDLATLKTKFNFNDTDNLIFLSPEVHLNGARGHSAYDDVIKDLLEADILKDLSNVEDALEEVFLFVNNTKEVIKAEYLGQRGKVINNLKLNE